jgi:hypothetical protein
LRSLQEIQPDFEEEAKAFVGLWSQGKKKKNYYQGKIQLQGIVCFVTFHILLHDEDVQYLCK